MNIKKGDRFAIYTSSLAAPLLREVVREVLHAGAHPEPFISIPGIQELMLKEG